MLNGAPAPTDSKIPHFPTQDVAQPPRCSTVRQPPLDGAAAPTRRCGSPHSTGGGGGIGGVVPFVLDRTVKRVIALGAENGFTGRMTPSDGPAAAAVADRLCQRFSEIPTALVHDLVAKSFEQFEGARVRD